MISRTEGKSMWSNWLAWFHGLVAAVIGGGASAVSAGFGAAITDPDHFGLDAHRHAHLFYLMGVTFLVSGALSAAGYLKQSPLPPITSS